MDIIKPITQLSDLDGEPVDIGAEDTDNKGQANGYAALDANGDIDPSQLTMELILQDDSL